MSKHTPGPWKVIHGRACNIQAPDGHGYLATIKVRHTKTNNLTEQLANARLIAAAPELLEALRYIDMASEVHEMAISDAALDGECQITVTLESLRQMKAAITKATAN